MIRICTSLSKAGYEVELVGVKKKTSVALTERPFGQERISVLFTKTFLFYFEYNIKLFFFLLFRRCDVLCCIDLDTMLPVFFTSVIRRKKRVYDAHEYFSQQKEIVTRPHIYKFWYWLEKTFVPRFKLGYTVNKSIAEIFSEKYKVNYEVIRNVPVKTVYADIVKRNGKIIYQGSVNEGRGFEQLIPAMKKVDTVLDIYGNGNFFEQTQQLIKENGVEDKVFLKGYVAPEQLKNITPQYSAGITLFVREGLNQYLSLANRFFDYIQSGVPQLTMDYPEYRKVNDEYPVSLMITSLSQEEIASGLNRLLSDQDLHATLVQGCLAAREVFNWQEEEKKLISFYKEYFG